MQVEGGRGKEDVAQYTGRLSVCGGGGEFTRITCDFPC